MHLGVRGHCTMHLVSVCGHGIMHLGVRTCGHGTLLLGECIHGTVRVGLRGAEPCTCPHPQVGACCPPRCTGFTHMLGRADRGATHRSRINAMCVLMFSCVHARTYALSHFGPCPLSSRRRRRVGPGRQVSSTPERNQPHDMSNM